MGGNWYCRSKDSMFEVPKPLSSKGVGVDAIPLEVRNSDVLTGNDLGKLGNVAEIPSQDEVKAFAIEMDLMEFSVEERHRKARELIRRDRLEEAWKIILL